MRLLRSALFWRLLFSSLAVVLVLGWGITRATTAHEDLTAKFKRLVRHDLRLADDAEVLLRLLGDMESGKRGYLLTRQLSYRAPFDEAAKDLDGVLTEAKDVAEDGPEDERIASFRLMVQEWVTRSTAQMNSETNPEPSAFNEEKLHTEQMRAILSELRERARNDAQLAEADAFRSAKNSQQETRFWLGLAIVIALAFGVLIARDVANVTREIEEALDATGRLEPLPELPHARSDEFGHVSRSLIKMAAVLVEKDSRLRATLSEREKVVTDLTHANETLARRDARGRAYADFVRNLRTLDVRALAETGLKSLVSLAEAHVGVVYLLDGAERLVPAYVSSCDGGVVERTLLSAEGLPRTAMMRREAVFLRGSELGDPRPSIGIGFGAVPLQWILAYPIAVDAEGAGTILLAGTAEQPAESLDAVRDAARQLGVALHNAWAHERLREKSAMLADQGETLSRANRVKTQFLASMSHELRTPLAAILGFADLLANSPKENLSPRGRESLERIKRNGDHLLSLINDVLDLAKAEAGRVDIRPVETNLSDLVRSSAAEVESLSSGKDVQLVVDIPVAAVTLVTDPQRVRQILLNLLSNALKFTAKGEVRLALQAGPSTVRVSVTDTGIGIPESMRPELFQDFHQLESGDGRKFDGTGVGLALSRRLARALGGDIEVQARDGEGSEFTLLLPRVGPSPTSSAHMTASVMDRVGT